MMNWKKVDSESIALCFVAYIYPFEWGRTTALQVDTAAATLSVVSISPLKSAEFVLLLLLLKNKTS
jgi:hypothetical protein